MEPPTKKQKTNLPKLGKALFDFKQNETSSFVDISNLKKKTSF